MAITGRSVYNELVTRTRDVESKHEDLSRRLYDYEHNISSLTENRGEAFTRLALIYLPELEAQAIAGTIKEVQADVQGIFEEKRARREELEENMQGVLARRKSLGTSLEQVTEEIEAKSSEKNTLMDQAAKNLEGDQDYAVLLTQARSAGDVLEKHKARVQELEQEAKKKLPAFRQNKLFSYLLGKGYGTDEYGARGLIGVLDSFVARVVNYEGQKINFDRLNNVPQKAAALVAKEEASYNDLIGRGKVMEKEVFDRIGLTKVIGEGQALVKRRDRIQDDIEGTDSLYVTYTQERKELDNTKGAYHLAAIAKLKAYLKGETIASLKRKALETPSPEDDRLVENIERIDAQVRTLKDQAITVKSQRDVIAAKLEEFNGLQSQFTRNGYNSSDSRFRSGFDASSFILGMLTGQYSRDSVWTQMRNHHYVYEPPAPTPTYTHHSSDSGGFGGFGGGGHSSGGGFGGGGFSSGKGF